MTHKSQTHDPGGRKTVFNPYLSSKKERLPNSGCHPMGLHSKQRVGSILAARRQGAGRKQKIGKQKPSWKNELVAPPPPRLGDLQGFSAKQHCVVCKAMYLGRKKPHRPHHVLCDRNKATKGKSLETVRVLKVAQENLALNSKPPASSGQTEGTTASEKFNAVWGRSKRNVPPPAPVPIPMDLQAKMSRRNLCPCSVAITFA